MDKFQLSVSFVDGLCEAINTETGSICITTVPPMGMEEAKYYGSCPLTNYKCDFNTIDRLVQVSCRSGQVGRRTTAPKGQKDQDERIDVRRAAPLLS